MAIDESKMRVVKTPFYIFDIGYEKRTIEDFLSILKSKGIKTVIDIRERATSRKREFNKTRLKQNLQDVSIKYKHFKELGSPFEIRQTLRKNKNYSTFFKGYNKHLANEKKTLAEIEKHVQNNSTALLCYERDILKCHRKSIVRTLKSKGIKSISR